MINAKLSVAEPMAPQLYAECFKIKWRKKNGINITWGMELHVIPAVIIFVLNFHTLVTFDDSRLIKSDATLSCERGAACLANMILFCLFTQ